MLFKKIILISLLTLSTQGFSATETIFRVSPYLLRHTNGHLLVNFQLKKDKKLVIDDDGIKKSPILYKMDVHYKIELKEASCGKTKELRIEDAESKEFFYENSQPPSPCHDTPNEEPFVFGFISDTQQYTQRHEAISQVIAHQHSIEPLQFLINGGDVVEEGASEKEWIKYFIGGELYLKDIPQIAAIGNHDYWGTVGKPIPKYFQQFMRWDGADKNGNLFFSFHDFKLLILNSNFSRLSLNEESETWNWIEENIKKAKKINKPIIIATHFPVYASSLDRFSSLSVMKMRTKLVPLVEKYKVPLVLSGHTHMYERSYKDGIYYLVAGPAGGKANNPSYKNKYRQMIDPDALTFTKIKVMNKMFTLETFNQDNKMIDRFIVNFKARNLNDDLY